MAWSEVNFKPAGELPEGWYAPRKEFFLAGFSDAMYPFAFDTAPISVTVPADGGGTRYAEFAGAKCRDCGGTMVPRDETLIAHAKLHLAVKLAREAVTA